MLKDKLPKFDDKMLSNAIVGKQVSRLKDQLTEAEFLSVLQYLQYGVPYGELKVLLDEELFSRDYREYDPVGCGYSGKKTGLELFHKYIRSNQKVMEEGYSFVFYGANSSGKTLLALFILCAFIERGYSGYYIHWKTYMNLFNAVMYNHEDKYELLDHIYNCELLVLDELGKESNVTENVLGELEHLIKHRAANDLPTILITNLTFDESSKIKSFQSKYKNSVYQALLRKYRFIQLSSGGDFRAKTRDSWEL